MSFLILVKTAPEEATVRAPREAAVSHFHLQWMRFLPKVQLSATDPSPTAASHSTTPSSWYLDGVCCQATGLLASVYF